MPFNEVKRFLSLLSDWPEAMHSQRNATWKVSNQGGLGKKSLISTGYAGSFWWNTAKVINLSVLYWTLFLAVRRPWEKSDVDLNSLVPRSAVFAFGEHHKLVGGFDKSQMHQIIYELYQALFVIKGRQQYQRICDHIFPEAMKRSVSPC